MFVSPCCALRLQPWAVALVGVAVAVVSVVLVGGAHSATHSSGQIAFARGDGIYVMNPDGSGVRALRRGVVAVELAWSPDGSRLALSGGPVGRHDGGILAMNANGSGLVRLVAGDGLSRPTWSPDGSRIAFSGQPVGRDHSGIWVMNADGRNLHRISSARLDRMTFGGWGPFDVDWSSTGRLVFTAVPTRCGDFGPDIYVMNVNGSNLRDITPGCRSREPHDPNPEWSPDGRRIAYARDDEVWVMNADGRSPLRLTHTLGSLEYEPVWSPDGRRIVFTRQGKGIYVMNADGTHTTRLTAGWNPDWQPVAAP